MRVETIVVGPSGFSQDALKTAVELRLRSFGVKVIDSNGPGALPVPFLMVVVYAYQGSGTELMYSINVQLEEPALLLRDLSKISADSITWNTFESRCCDITVVGRVKEVTLEKVGKFLNDWMKANAQ